MASARLLLHEPVAWLTCVHDHFQEQPRIESDSPGEPNASPSTVSGTRMRFSTETVRVYHRLFPRWPHVLCRSFSCGERGSQPADLVVGEDCDAFDDRVDMFGDG